jgi:hypothetical protein
VGSYSGQGKVVLSSNALWAVGNGESLTAQITQQTNGLISGSIKLQSLLLEVSGSVVRGEASSFSIYTSGFAVINGCSAEARAVVSGVLDPTASPTTISGGLALRFTGNFAQGCTTEQMTSYPGTGADFQHSESRLP